MRVIDADSLTASLLDCPDDEEVGLKNTKEAGGKDKKWLNIRSLQT